MICTACKADQHDLIVQCPDCYGGSGKDCPRCRSRGTVPACPGGTWCDCQHRYGTVTVISPDGQYAGQRVLLGVATPTAACTCLEHVDQARGRVAVPPPAGCPEHGYLARWVGATLESAGS